MYVLQHAAKIFLRYFLLFPLSLQLGNHLIKNPEYQRIFKLEASKVIEFFNQNASVIKLIYETRLLSKINVEAQIDNLNRMEY